MVIGSLIYAERYFSLHKDFEKAFKYARENAMLLGIGRHTIEEDNIYLIISDNELRPVGKAPLEAHNNFIDIQIILDGEERFGIRDRDRCYSSQGGYSESRDIEFFNDSYHNIVSLTKGDFVIFFPEDAHAPLIGDGKVYKAILKIKV